MNDIQKNINDVFLQSFESTSKWLKVDEKFAFLEDPATGVVRTRTTAELCLSMIKIQKLKIRNYEKIIQKMINWLIFKQNDDGSWNETHVNYDYPSSVFTAICASTLFEAHMEIGIKISVENLENAADFLIEQEISEGHFRKSEHYHADVLNADAMVSAFLIKFGYYKNNSKYIKAAKRGMKNILKQQKSNGEIPYGTNIVQYPYKHHLDVPCIHYQTVTLYYLEKYREIEDSEELETAIREGILWLIKNQKSTGEYNWENSGLNFALYLTATYAFGTYLYLKNFNNDKKRIIDSINMLKKQYENGILLRWEKPSFFNMVKGIVFSIQGGCIGNYPMNFRLLRIIHRIYREISRYKKNSKMLPSKIAKIKIGYSAILSTVESSTNYPDLYMTTEALDALSSSLERTVEK